MNEMYKKIKGLCDAKGTNITKVCKEIDIPRSVLSELSSGRTKQLSNKYLPIVAEYFGVSVDYLLGNEKKPSGETSGGHNVEVLDENDNVVVLDDETRDLIDSLRKNPEMKMLFSVSKGATKEDIIKAVKIIEALKDTNRGE